MGILNTSTLLLTNYFLINVRNLKVNNKGKIETPTSYKKEILRQVEILLRKGYSYKAINERFKLEGKIENYGPLDLFNKKELEIGDKFIKPKDELIQYGLFYYHPLLQEKNKGKTYYIDYDTMEEKESPGEPFFLEIIDSFTITDLLNYFHKETDQALFLERNPYMHKNHYSQFVDILKQKYSLDLILYMIDTAVINAIDEDTYMVKQPKQLPQFLDSALMMFQNRKEILEEGGMDHVIPRSNTYN